MTRDEALDRVQIEMARVLNRDRRELGESVNLIDDLGADSLDFIEILMPVEEYFDIDAGQGGLDHVRTVGDFVDHVMAARTTAAAT